MPTPNSDARLMEGTAGLSTWPAVPGRIRLVRGGGGREVSGSLLGLRNLSDVTGVRPATSFDGFRNLSGRGPGADGVRAGASGI